MQAPNRCPVGCPGSSTTALYNAIRPLLFSIALRVTGNPSDAEDAVQDAFLAIIERTNRPVCARAFLTVAVRNRAISSFRDRLKVVQLIESRIAAQPAVDLAPRPPIRLLKYAQAAGGDRRLPTIWRGIAAGQSYREIGTDVGMSVNAIKSLICRSRKRLDRVVTNGGGASSMKEAGIL